MSSIDLGILGLSDAEQVGAGGFATVYRAMQPNFNRVVAVKVLDVRNLDETGRRRFERECKAMGAIGSHPGIVSIFDAGFTEDGRPYLLMPYLSRGSLADRLERFGAYGWEEATRVGVTLAAALETAHRAGIVHRDVKPANVLVSDYGEPQLTDFGIARIADGPETRSGVITASFGHVAPEIISGAPPSEAADVYSLASTLFTIIRGFEPFRRNEDEPLVTLVARVVSEPVPDLRPFGVPGPVCDVLERALSKTPDERPAGAAEFGTELQRVQAAAGMRPTDLVLGAPSGWGDEDAAATPAAPAPAAPADDPTTHVEAGPGVPAREATERERLEPAAPNPDADVAVADTGESSDTVTDQAQARARSGLDSASSEAPPSPPDHTDQPVTQRDTTPPADAPVPTGTDTTSPEAPPSPPDHTDQPVTQRDTTPPADASVPPPVPTRRTRRRWPWAALVVLIAGLAGGAVLWWPSNDAPAGLDRFLQDAKVVDHDDFSEAETTSVARAPGDAGAWIFPRSNPQTIDDGQMVLSRSAADPRFWRTPTNESRDFALVIDVEFTERPSDLKVSLEQGLWGTTAFRIWSVYLSLDEGLESETVKGAASTTWPMRSVALRTGVRYRLVMAATEAGEFRGWIWPVDSPDDVTSFSEDVGSGWVRTVGWEPGIEITGGDGIRLHNYWGMTHSGQFDNGG